MNETMRPIAEQLVESLNAGISDDAFRNVMKKVDAIKESIEDDIMWRLKDDLASNLSAFVVDMAEHSVRAILEGNDAQMRRYLGCERDGYTGRGADDPNWMRQRAPHEWHEVIHGKLFEYGPMVLRRSIVEAHRDLITDQRVLDLEDQVKSLIAQVNRANAQKEEMAERLREI